MSISERLRHAGPIPSVLLCREAALELDRLTAEVARLEGLLKRVEWIGSHRDPDYSVCPVCKNIRHEAHKPTCELAAAIKDA